MTAAAALLSSESLHLTGGMTIQLDTLCMVSSGVGSMLQESTVQAHCQQAIHRLHYMCRLHLLQTLFP